LKQISSWHIHINGQVQGVGFRPFIYRLAQKFKLTGWVKNAFDGVHIEFNADEITSKNFYDEVLLHAPTLSHITSHCMKKKSSIV
jgi:hydrogenase maturation protein HypF